MWKSALAVAFFWMLTEAGAYAAEPPRTDRSEAQKQVQVASVWNHSVNGGREHPVTLYANGKINEPDGTATWSLNGRLLVLRWPDPAAPGGAWIDSCRITADWRTYVGKVLEF